MLCYLAILAIMKLTYIHIHTYIHTQKIISVHHRLNEIFIFLQFAINLEVALLRRTDWLVEWVVAGARFKGCIWLHCGCR